LRADPREDCELALEAEVDDGAELSPVPGIALLHLHQQFVAGAANSGSLSARAFALYVGIEDLVLEAEVVQVVRKEDEQADLLAHVVDVVVDLEVVALEAKQVCQAVADHGAAGTADVRGLALGLMLVCSRKARWPLPRMLEP
jgi:hypothetical protein